MWHLKTGGLRGFLTARRDYERMGSEVELFSICSGYSKARQYDGWSLMGGGTERIAKLVSIAQGLRYRRWYWWPSVVAGSSWCHPGRCADEGSQSRTSFLYGGTRSSSSS
ncbi:hypothetical protein CPC08DRAFT_434795 [Agrocybe pediades]|nr:hypothetical protein CPC08DRAFT_434795 [Agrocybe pediades]